MGWWIMKVTLEYDNGFDARRALGGIDAWLVLRALDEEMRADIKHGGDVMHDSEHWRSRLFSLCDDYSVDLDDDN